MKPYQTAHSKGRWPYFWRDKVKPRFKRIFKKSARRQAKTEITNELNRTM